MKQHSLAAPLIAVALLAAAIRLAVLPHATTDGGDAVYRVWIAWRWLDAPQFIPHHGWGPLHFYLIGGVLALFPDPVLPPIILHVMLGVGISLLLYVFTRLEFGSGRAALIVALTSAVYPVAVRNSVSVRSETPCALFVLAAMVFISRARKTDNGRAQAIAAGFFMTLAGMLRYEVWLLIPFFAVLFWRKRPHGLLFLAVAIIHPVIWTIVSLINTGDPFHSMNWAANWEIQAMGRSALEFSERLRSGTVFPDQCASRTDAFSRSRLYRGSRPRPLETRRIGAVAATVGHARCRAGRRGRKGIPRP
jgi:4-amino-4-deoxy-L-arabinose transferase-like glycosyltransferase